MCTHFSLSTAVKARETRVASFLFHYICTPFLPFSFALAHILCIIPFWGETETDSGRREKWWGKARETRLSVSAVKVLEKGLFAGRGKWEADRPKLLSSAPTQKFLCNCAYTDLYIRHNCPVQFFRVYSECYATFVECTARPSLSSSFSFCCFFLSFFFFEVNGGMESPFCVWHLCASLF